MQPRSPAPSPHSPNPDYDFILNDQKGPIHRTLGIPHLSGKAFISLAIVLAILLFSIFYSILFGGKTNSTLKVVTPVIGKAQEINRVNTAEQGQLKSADSLDLLSTAQSALASEQAELSAYLSSHHLKLNLKLLATYKNSATDAQLQSAAQSNNLDSAYTAYLRQSLQDYQAALTTAYSSSTSAALKTILQNAYASTQTLLSSPQFK